MVFEDIAAGGNLTFNGTERRFRRCPRVLLKVSAVRDKRNTTRLPRLCILLPTRVPPNNDNPDPTRPPETLPRVPPTIVLKGLRLNKLSNVLVLEDKAPLPPPLPAPPSPSSSVLSPLLTLPDGGPGIPGDGGAREGVLAPP